MSSAGHGNGGDEIEEITTSPAENAMGKKFVHCSVKLLDGQVLRFNIEVSLR
jgi:hypothetical protein